MGKILLGIADVTLLYDEEQYRKAYDVVSQYRQQKADCLNGRMDKARCVASGLLLNALLVCWQRKQAGALEEASDNKPVLNFFDLKDMMAGYRRDMDYSIEVGIHGKPVFKDRKDIHFNLSHSGQYVVGAVSDQPVGVDIDGNRPIREGLAKRFFSDEECRWICEKKDCENSRFFAVWTGKEAYGKLTGDGVVASLGREFMVSEGEFRLKEADVYNGGDIYNSCDVRFYQYCLEDYYITLAKFR